MARKDSPYLPFYVQDFITDEKLMECSASSTGVYIRIMCVLHKSTPYGKLLLKQKDKQTDSKIKNFAYKLAKHFPYSNEVVLSGLEELINEQVLQIEGDFLCQKRMVNDGILSAIRSESGKNGAKLKKSFAKAKVKANTEANTDNDNDNEINNKVVFNTFPILKNFNGLPEIKIGAAKELVRISTGIDITDTQVNDIWGVFKIQNLTGKKYYADEDSVYSHFINWVKTQKFNNGNKSNNTKSGRNNGAIQLLENIKQNTKP